MTVPSSQEGTQLLLAWRAGDQAALVQLTPRVYAEPHRLAVKAWLHRALSKSEPDGACP